MSTNPQLKAKCRVLNYVNINILKKLTMLVSLRLNIKKKKPIQFRISGDGNCWEMQ